MALLSEKMTPRQASQALVLFMKMLDAANKEEAHSFFEQAIRSIYVNEKNIPHNLLQQFDWAYALIKKFNPKEEVESFLCAQYILCHIIGMHKIGQQNYLDQRIAIRLIKLSNIALERLQDKRMGNSMGISKKSEHYGNKTLRS